MKRLALLTALGVLLGTAGCGGELDQPRAPGSAAKPQPSFNRPDLQETARRDAKMICELSTPQEIADAYGGQVDDPSSLARAYATISYTPSTRDSAEVGCLEGLIGR